MFFFQISCSNKGSCKDQSKCIALLCYGKFLHTVVAGWDDSECQKVFDSVCQHMCIQRLVKGVVASNPGQFTHRDTT